MTIELSYLVLGAMICGFAGWVIADRRSAHKMAQLDWKILSPDCTGWIWLSCRPLRWII